MIVCAQAPVGPVYAADSPTSREPPMTALAPIPVWFHEDQLAFKPRYEWAFGDKLSHPETTARAESILAALQLNGAAFDLREPKTQPLPSIRRQHDAALLTLYRTAEALGDDETFYPMVFPRALLARADAHNLHHAGAFCFDSGTPLSSRTFEAAAWSAATAIEAARCVRDGSAPIAYALSRPPGHHATRREFGGYCYFNNAGLAARVLRRRGRVAIVDIDFHHGNGTQTLFYRDPRVLTVSLHGDPTDFFPFFIGFSGEIGTGPGRGFNRNICLAEGIDGPAYLAALDDQVLPTIRAFEPEFLVIAAGLDGYHKDPIGHFALQTDDFAAIGDRLGGLGLPTVAVQEGGYYTPHLGRNAVALLTGIRAGRATGRLKSGLATKT